MLHLNVLKVWIFLMVWKILHVDTLCVIHAVLCCAQIYRLRLASRTTTLYLWILQLPEDDYGRLVETRNNTAVN